MKKLPIIGVMGSGTDKQAETAEPLGRALAALDVHLLTGGGYGIMHSVAKGFTSVADRQGLSIGCIPMKANGDGQYETTSKSYPNAFIEVPIFTPLGVYDAQNPDALTRNYVNILTSDVVIALPGGAGTIQEVELAQKFSKAVLLYGPENKFTGCPKGLPRANNLNEVTSWVSDQISGRNCSLAEGP